jgi:hypothetical protein
MTITKFRPLIFLISQQQQQQKLTVGNQPARSHLASGPSGTHDHIFVQCLDLFFSFCWSSLLIKEGLVFYIYIDPCGGGVEYLHHDPASRRRRRKGKSQNWDSKIQSRDPWDSGPRKTALVRAISIYKRQTRPLVRDGASQKQDRNCQSK